MSDTPPSPNGPAERADHNSCLRYNLCSSPLTQMQQAAASPVPAAKRQGVMGRSKTRPETPDGEQTVHIALLGGFRIQHGHVEVASDAWPLAKAASLVKLLALSPSGRLHREEIIELLWPALGREAGGNNLRQALFVARRTLETLGPGQADLLVRLGDFVALSSEHQIQIDVKDFERAAERANGSGDSELHAAAIALYAGELLPEDRYEDWALARRETLRSTYLGLLLEAARLDEACGRYPAAISWLSRAIDEDPANEEAHVALMRVYARSGRRRESLEQYRLLERALREELDAAPDQSSQQLHADILARRFPPQPAAASADPAGRGMAAPALPVYLTSFVGREREIASIRRMLATRRLVTLTGSGGVGKTRLASVLAAELEDSFPMGVRSVDLSALSDPALVQPVIMSTLDMETSDDPRTHIGNGPAPPERALLLLDNCEHLIETLTPLITRLLRARPWLHILATSREVLRVPGETVWNVKPLRLPDPHRDHTLEELRESEAVGLFLDRLRLRQPDLILTHEIAPHIVGICRRVDGLPLAIEMAAARAATMALPELEARLDDAITLLARPGYPGPPRHETLRATLEWSYQLLSEDERAVFARLAIFAGGWTLDAAEAVVAQPGEPALATTLSELVDKSLVVREGDLLNARYRLLAPVRQYAREQLAARGESERLWRCHADYFLNMAETAEPHLTGPKQGEWLLRLEREHGNFRAALRRALDAGEVDRATRLAGALAHFWWAHSHYTEGRAWLMAVLERMDESAALPRAKVLAGLANLAQYQGDWSATRQFCERQIELWRALGDRQGTARALGTLAMAVGELGDIERSVELLEESLEISREIGDQAQMARMLNSLGEVARLREQPERSIELYGQSLSIYEQLGDRQRATTVRHNLAYALQLQGQHHEAAELFRACLESYLQVGSDDGVAQCLTGLAGVAAVTGEPDRAAQLFGAAEALRTAIGATEDAADRAQTARHVALVRDALGEAELARLWDAGSQLPREQAIELAAGS